MFRLALALGRTFQELGDSMTGQELTRWMEYDAIEPIGEQRADLRAGIVASTIANCHRVSGEPFKPKDFMAFRPAEKLASPAEALKKLRKMYKTNG